MWIVALQGLNPSSPRGLVLFMRPAVELESASAGAGSALAVAPLSVQTHALLEIIAGDPDLIALLRLICDLELADGWLIAGCIYLELPPFDRTVGYCAWARMNSLGERILSPE